MFDAISDGSSAIGCATARILEEQSAAPLASVAVAMVNIPSEDTEKLLDKWEQGKHH